MSHIKPVFKCADSYKHMFKQSQCLLTISVGQEVHEEEKFATTIELVNNSFASCIMLIDDSLQRHTMALNTNNDAEYYYEDSVKEGNLWLKRNEKYYNRLKILNKIIRWDNWLNHLAHKQKQKEITSLIRNNMFYRNAFELTINEFLRRYMQRLDDQLSFDVERARLLCLNYLVEECAALCLWPEMNCQFEVYPGKRNLAMFETHRRFVLPECPEQLHAVAIKFKNRKQLKPQIFELFRNSETIFEGMLLE